MDAIVTRYLRLGVVAIALTVMSGPAWAQSGGAKPAQCVAPKGNPIPDNASVRSVRGSIATAPTVAALSDTLQACRENLGESSKKPNVAAYACVGEALAKTAQLSPIDSEKNYTDALCYFQQAADLSAKLTSVPAATRNEIQANARLLRAKALMALRDLSGPQSDSGKNYLAAALTDFEAARNLGASQDIHLQLGRAYIAANRFADAELEIAALPAGPEKAGALVNLAEKQRGTAASEEILRILRLASNAAPSSPAISGALGVEYYRKKDLQSARAAFFRATTLTGDGALIPGGTNYRSEAYYYLSVMDAQTAASRVAWGGVFSNASAAQPQTEFRYRRQACFAYIGKGGEDLTKDDNRYCQSDPDTAEGQLMLGMYHLRRAQYLPSTKDILVVWTERLQNAKAAFQRGRAIATANAAQTSAKIDDWPGNPSVVDALAYGEAVVDRVITRCVLSPQAASPAVADLFLRLDLNRPADRARCGSPAH